MRGRSLLLVAPTGLGKTLAVTGDLQEHFSKTVYGVPLRALGGGIQREITGLRRGGQPLRAVIHHGDQQDSVLFGEEVIVTTYDQIVCGVPGLPLSLPLKAGHAVAGALLMSRLILDEAHLAWGISDDALTILLGIVHFRRGLGLQTILLTATLPDAVARCIASEFDLDIMIVGRDELANDQGLELRESNRVVAIETLKLDSVKAESGKRPDWNKLDEKLRGSGQKRIYFANTVEQIQKTYDRLTQAGVHADSITVLHNRMPRSQRNQAEVDAYARFGKGTPDGDWLLLTNQVAEAGLDISAQRVISDPAPVDTLVQRAGRCARWFRDGVTNGCFYVVDGQNNEIRKDLSQPYHPSLVDSARKTLPNEPLTWAVECRWINTAWGGDPKRALEKVKSALDQVDFALNLFDRAAQQHRPGEIAKVFREILSVDAAVEDSVEPRDLQLLLNDGKRPETSSISLGRAWQVSRESKGAAKVIRYEEGDLHVDAAEYVQPGEILILPSSIAYLHPKKGLCFGDADEMSEAIKSSAWGVPHRREQLPREGGRRQKLEEHVEGVMRRTYARLTEDGAYSETLKKILRILEPDKDTQDLSSVIAQVATLAAGFHDLGKADQRWQQKARAIDPDFGDGLIGRTARTGTRIGIPHTPPGYLATMKAAELLLGPLNSAEYLIRAIALAAARHHSSLLNPSAVDYQYQPHPGAIEFVRGVLADLAAPDEVQKRANEILEAAAVKPKPQNVPLLLPNDDLFPVYALVGCAILMADREDASNQDLEQWKHQ